MITDSGTILTLFDYYTTLTLVIVEVWSELVLICSFKVERIRSPFVLSFHMVVEIGGSGRGILYFS